MLRGGYGWISGQAAESSEIGGDNHYVGNEEEVDAHDAVEVDVDIDGLWNRVVSQFRWLTVLESSRFGLLYDMLVLVGRHIEVSAMKMLVFVESVLAYVPVGRVADYNASIWEFNCRVLDL